MMREFKMKCFEQLVQRPVILTLKEWKMVLDLVKIGSGEKARDSAEAEEFNLLQKKIRNQVNPFKGNYKP